MIADLIIAAVLLAIIVVVDRPPASDLRARLPTVLGWARATFRGRAGVSVALLLALGAIGWGRAVYARGGDAFNDFFEDQERTRCFTRQSMGNDIDLLTNALLEHAEHATCPVGGGLYEQLDGKFRCPVHGVAPARTRSR